MDPVITPEPLEPNRVSDARRKPSRAADARAPGAQPGNSVEPAPHVGRLVIEGQPIARLTFTKRQPGDGLRVDFRAKDAEGRTVASGVGLDLRSLADEIGAANVKRIEASRSRGGTLEGEQLMPADDAKSIHLEALGRERLPDDRFAALIEKHASEQHQVDPSEKAAARRIDERWSWFRTGAPSQEPGRKRDPVAFAAVAEKWVTLDASDVARIGTQGLRELAVDAIHQNSLEVAAYGAALRQHFPALDTEAVALEARSADRTALKEAHKGTEAADMEAARRKTAEKGHAAHLDEAPAVKHPEPPPPAQPEAALEAAALATRETRAKALTALLGERYLVKGDEYRFRGEPTRIAFVDRGSKLTTNLDAPSVARSMVDLAETKGWEAIRVHGDDSYCRQVWLEASLRDFKVIGFEPSAEDRAMLDRDRQARQRNQIELPLDVPRAVKAEHSGANPAQSNARNQVLAVLRSALSEQKVDARTTDEVLRAAALRMDKLEAAGRPLPQVRVYDPHAPRQAPVRVQVPQQHN